MHEQIFRLAKRLYDCPVMDNRERGDYAEQLVASKIEPSWRWVGIGWHPWDFETGEGSSRVRMQVRQSAAKQIWKRPEKRVPFFATTIKPKPSYVQRNNPTLTIEKHGRFCELYVFAWHGNDGAGCDHRLPEQWTFFVLPERALGLRKSVKVRELESSWLSDNGGQKASWSDLANAVEALAATVRAA